MSVTAPAGFLAAGIAAGIKDGGGPDLAMVVNQGPRFAAAGLFTSNRVCAAPVKWSRAAVADGRLRAVVLNSGGANACTGADGLADAAQTAAATARLLDCPDREVAVCSTGLIGVRLPMPSLLAGLPRAAGALAADGGSQAAMAILTTDTHAKQASASSPAGYTIAGMAKGAGMLAPSLATMLVVITTDADIAAWSLAECLRTANSLTFDRIDSDGCQSTNDSVLALASGASGVVPETAEFTMLLARVCWLLARQLIGDAEGAAHDIEIEVAGAATESDALTVARAIARNNLFKCAIFGKDPNWGRILAAIGVTDAAFDAEQLDVVINGVPVCLGSAPAVDRNQVDLSGRHCLIHVDLHAGPCAATIWTNDLTYDYVKENAEYSS